MNALFVAYTYAEAAHWARAWGFEPREWGYVRGREDVFRHFGGDLDAPSVFVAGSVPMAGVLYELEMFGFDTFIDAHDHPTDPEPQSALPVLQGDRTSRTVRPM